MTEAEVIAKLITLAKDAKEGDEYTAHVEADCFLCDFLDALGYPDVSKAFNRIQPKRYE